MGYEIKLIETKAQPALVIKSRAKIEEVGQAIGEILGKVAQHLERMNAQPAGAPFTRTFQFANGVFEFEAGFPVGKDCAPEGEIIATELPAALVVTTIHAGSQETTELAYRALHEWMAKNNKVEAGAPWEMYLTDPETTPDDKAATQIFFPVR